MEPDKLVAIAIKDLGNDKFEIYPGMAKVLKIMSRIAPQLLFNQLSKPVNGMLAQTKI